MTAKVSTAYVGCCSLYERGIIPASPSRNPGETTSYTLMLGHGLAEKGKLELKCRVAYLIQYSEPFTIAATEGAAYIVRVLNTPKISPMKRMHHFTLNRTRVMRELAT